LDGMDGEGTGRDVAEGESESWGGLLPVADKDSNYPLEDAEEMGGWWMDPDTGAVKFKDGRPDVLPWALAASDEERGMTPKMSAARGTWLKRSRKAPADTTVCVCGHPVARHLPGGTCAPTRMSCWCREARPVMEVGDTRAFLRKTKGVSAHALSSGVDALHGKQKSWAWLPGKQACAECGEQGVVVFPLVVNTATRELVVDFTGFIPREARDELFCWPCVEKLFPSAAALLARGGE
jgi:hypothetical protein